MFQRCRDLIFLLPIKFRIENLRPQQIPSSITRTWSVYKVKCTYSYHTPDNFMFKSHQNVNIARNSLIVSFSICVVIFQVISNLKRNVTGKPKSFQTLVFSVGVYISDRSCLFSSYIIK